MLIVKRYAGRNWKLEIRNGGSEEVRAARPGGIGFLWSHAPAPRKIAAVLSSKSAKRLFH